MRVHLEDTIPLMQTLGFPLRANPMNNEPKEWSIDSLSESPISRATGNEQK